MERPDASMSREHISVPFSRAAEMRVGKRTDERIHSGESIEKPAGRQGEGMRKQQEQSG